MTSPALTDEALASIVAEAASNRMVYSDRVDTLVDALRQSRRELAAAERVVDAAWLVDSGFDCNGLVWINIEKAKPARLELRAALAALDAAKKGQP